MYNYDCCINRLNVTKTKIKGKWFLTKEGEKKADSCDPMDQLNPTHSITLRSHVRNVPFLRGSNAMCSWGGKEKNEIGWKEHEEENVIFMVWLE